MVPTEEEGGVEQTSRQLWSPIFAINLDINSLNVLGTKKQIMRNLTMKKNCSLCLM